MKAKNVLLVCFIIMLIVSGIAVGRIIMEKNNKSLIKKFPSKFREKAVFCTRENDLDFTKDSTDAEISLGLISIKNFKAEDIEIIDKENNISCKTMRIDQRDINTVFPIRYCAVYNNLNMASVLGIEDIDENNKKDDNRDYSYIHEEYDILSSSSFPSCKYTIFKVKFEIPDEKCTINNLTVKLDGKEYNVNVGSIRFNQVNSDSEKYDKSVYPKIKSYNFASDIIIFDDDNTYKTNTFCIKTDDKITVNDIRLINASDNTTIKNIEFSYSDEKLTFPLNLDEHSETNILFDIKIDKVNNIVIYNKNLYFEMDYLDKDGIAHTKSFYTLNSTYSDIYFEYALYKDKLDLKDYYEYCIDGSSYAYRVDSIYELMDDRCEYDYPSDPGDEAIIVIKDQKLEFDSETEQPYFYVGILYKDPLVKDYISVTNPKDNTEYEVEFYGNEVVNNFSPLLYYYNNTFTLEQEKLEKSKKHVDTERYYMLFHNNMPNNEAKCPKIFYSKFKVTLSNFSEKIDKLDFYIKDKKYTSSIGEITGKKNEYDTSAYANYNDSIKVLNQEDYAYIANWEENYYKLMIPINKDEKLRLKNITILNEDHLKYDKDSSIISDSYNLVEGNYLSDKYYAKLYLKYDENINSICFASTLYFKIDYTYDGEEYTTIESVNVQTVDDPALLYVIYKDNYDLSECANTRRYNVPSDYVDYYDLYDDYIYYE